MEKEKLESMMIDYIDGILTGEDVKWVEDQLAHFEEARRLHAQLIEVMGALSKSPQIEPTVSLQLKFAQTLRDEVARTEASLPAGRQVFFSTVFFRAAAAIVLLMVTGMIAWWTIKNQQQQDEMAALRKEVEATRRVMMAMLDNQQSASTRMKGATVAFNMEKTDDVVVNTLVKMMNEDPNTNVRLAALEALEKFNQQTKVRKALVASLATQKDPIVQISLIQLMVRMKEKGALKDLENITNDVRTMKAVKDEAYTGIMKLS
jgi:hypothetical protein